jgi:Zn finger protein HypA/HybF involved in hydrogenase expression
MHEWGLVAEAAREVERQSRGTAVEVVTLRLGPGAGDVMVRAAWDALTASGPLSTAELVIVRDEHRMQCLGCGREYPGQLPRPCPGCGGDGLVRAAAADLTVHGWATAGPARRGTAPDREQ